MKPWPWFGGLTRKWRADAAAHAALADPLSAEEIERAWLDGERVEEGTVAKKDGMDCFVCGDPPAPIVTSTGLGWAISICRQCEAEMAARALRRMLPKLLRHKLEQP